MENFVELHNRWRGFAAERAKAKLEVEQKTEANNAEIERLRAENINMQTSFEDHWRNKKKRLQEERDNAVLEQMAQGVSGQEILRQLGSRNTVWIYDLRKRLAAEGRLPESVNENSSPELLKQAKARTKQSEMPDAFAHIKWLRPEGAEFAGWSISDDFTLVKRERRGGVWFVCGPENEFLGGDRQFYDSTDIDLITTQADLLMDRLEAAEAS
jgi:hypothetical protein